MTFRNFDWANVLTFSSLKQIFQGCGVHFLEQFNKNPEEVSFVYKHRLNLCDSCEIQLGGQCRMDMESVTVSDFLYGNEYIKKGEVRNGCNCLVKCKAGSMSSVCPLGKWLPFQLNESINSEIIEIV